VLRAVLFDLDGVLIDSLPSIWRCLNRALLAMGFAPVSKERVRPLIGPPIEESASILIGSNAPELIGKFVALYRERYASTCAHESLPAEGLVEVLDHLSNTWKLAVATSKAEPYAQTILHALGVRARFAAICGRSLALDRESKREVIGRAVARLGARDDVRGLVMVGDRAHDVEGAEAFGIPTIGVLHGMGTEAELREAGARWIVDDLRAVARLLDRLASVQ